MGVAVGQGTRRRRDGHAGGIALRQQLEDETDRLTTLPWRLLGEQKARAFAEELEPPCALLLARVDGDRGAELPARITAPRVAAVLRVVKSRERHRPVGWPN